MGIKRTCEGCDKPFRKEGLFCYECVQEQKRFDKEWFFDSDGRIHSMDNFEDLYG